MPTLYPGAVTVIVRITAILPLIANWASLVAQLVKNPPAMQETGFDPWVRKISWRREQIPIPVF